MKTLLKLTFQELIFRRTRFLLALGAIIATCCMIVWFIGSFDILKSAAKSDIKNYFGDYQVIITKTGGGNLPETLIAALRADTKKVASADCAFQMSCNAARGISQTAGLDKVRGIMGTPQTNPVIMGMEMGVSPFEVEEGRWFQKLASGSAPQEPQTEMECLLSTSAKKMLEQTRGLKEDDLKDIPAEIRLGEIIDVNTTAGNFKLKVVGFLKQGISTAGLSEGGGGRRPAPPPQEKSPQGETKDAPKNAETEVAAGGGPTGAPGTPPPGGAGGGPGGRGGGVSLTEAAIYVPLETARKIAGKQDACNVVYVRIQGVPVVVFREQWERKCKLDDVKVAFHDAEGMQAMLDARDSAGSILKQAQGAIGLVVLAALLIIFTTLSMGVNERTRQLAILRTLGFTKGQVAGLIMLEGVLLGVIGWAGGLLAGWLMLWVIVMMNAGLDVPAVTLSGMTIMVALVTSLVGALLASLLPAWRATRVAPLDALAQNRTLPPKKGIILAGLTGAVLMAALWLLIFVVPMDEKLHGALSTVGIILSAVAVLLMAPAAVVVTETLFSPVLARLLGMNPAFLANELSSNKWRTLGTTLSLCVGLGLYSMFQVWGYSMLGPFTPSKNLPNTLVAFLPSGIPSSEVRAVMAVPGVVREDFMPLAVEQPKIAPELLSPVLEKETDGDGMGGRLAGQMDNVVLFGVDPQIAFRKDHPTVDVKYLDGSRHEALRAMCDFGQRACVIPDVLATRFNLKVGDKLPLVIPESARGQGRGGPGGPGGSGFGGMRGGGGGRPEGGPGAGGGKPGGGSPGTGGATVVEYKIVGIVEIPGWHWITKTTGVRTQSGRTAGMVFAAYENVKADFRLTRNSFFWMNMEPGTKFDFIESRMQEIASRSGGQETLTAEDNGHRAQSAAGVTQGFVKVSTYESLMDSIGRRSESMIQQAARMPLMILLITTLAVMNTMMASVRTRRWEMGILRTYGVTRSGLVRLIFAEAILIGICACLLSLGFGVFGAVCMVNSAAFFGAAFLGGVVPPMVIPWGHLAVGFSVAMGVCVLAAIIPAIQAGREEPAALLTRKE